MLMKHCYTLVTLLLLLSVQPQAFAGDDPLKKKAEEIHRKVITIDSHTDTPLQLMQEGFDMAARHDPKTEYSRIDFPRMKDGGLDAAFFAVFISQGPRNPDAYDRILKKSLILFDTIDAVLERYPDLAGKAENSADIIKLKRSGRRAVLIGIENGYQIGKDLSLISTFYLRGARYITLCHSSNNDICDSSTDTTEHGGLSPFGYEVVQEMNHVGMMIDVSHISDKAVVDVLSATTAPVIASHSCARALCDNPRNLSDSLLRAIAKNGGVVQMCLLSDYVKKPAPNPSRDSARAAVRKKYNDFEGLSSEQMKAARKEWYGINRQFPQVLATVSEVVDHIDHIVAVAGIDHVGIGTDFDGGGSIDGCIDVSEMTNITCELLRRGYSQRQIRKIWGGNLMRVMNSVDRISTEYKNSCHCS